MPDITAADVKKLRDATSAGMMDAKRALEEAAGDYDKAVDLLRKKGQARAEKKGGRGTGEGIVASYLHNSGTGAKLGVLIELNCETDFVAKTAEFHDLAREIALQVAGANPRFVRREEVPAELVERETAIYRVQVEGKPANIIEKIVEGKLEAFFAEICLVDQVYVRDEHRKKRVRDLLTEAIARVGENITVARFARFVVGETAAAAGSHEVASEPAATAAGG